MKTQRTVLVAALVLIVVMAGFGFWQNFRFGGPASYGRWAMGPGHMMGGWFGCGTGGIMGLIFWILILVVLVLAINWIAGMVRQTEGQRAGHQDAAEILKRRYAEGRIDKVEFEEKMKVISEN